MTDPMLKRLAARFDSLQTRSEIQDAIDDLEDMFDLFNELDQEIASRLIEQLNARLQEVGPAT